MTRNDLEQAVYRRLNKNTASVDAATETRIRHFLNQRHRRLMSMPGMALFQRTSDTLTTVADTATYTIEDTERIERLYEADNDRTLLPMTLTEYREIAPDPSAVTGVPTHVVIVSNVQPDFLIALYPTPSSAIEYSLDVVAAVTDLANDSAVPLLPEAFHDLLELGATLDELIKGDDGRYQIVRGEYEDRLRDLRYFVAKQLMAVESPREWSSYGPWFPADHWR